MKKNYMQKLVIILLICSLCFVTVTCGEKEIPSAMSTGKEEYENQTISIQSSKAGDKEITVAKMRTLDQTELNASLTRTTGVLEEFKAAGPTVKDVLALVEEDMQEYEALGFVGRDGYYCLVTSETIKNHELVLALAIDGSPELAKDTRPARLCIQGEYGPYWVRMVDKIVLYEEVPKKDIRTCWVFMNLVKDIEPYRYEYYGQKDDAIELTQVFGKFEDISHEAFFTMKSNDGFIKNEAMNLVSQRYYIKIKGKDAPMNISPHIKLGMNVQEMAWFSTNADAAIFPKQMAELLGEGQIDGAKGILLSEILEEVGVKDIEDKCFEILSVDGQTVKASGMDLYEGLLTISERDNYGVRWSERLELEPIENLLCVKVVE